MGEEVKKSEEGKKEATAPPTEEKPKQAKEETQETVAAKEEGGKKEEDGEKKSEKEAPPPPPPEEIVMRVFMHCEGCARKVKHCLRGFDGVDDVITDCKAHKVVVKGRKAAADPLKVVVRVQKKTGRKVELLTPLPPAPEQEKKEEEKEEEKPKTEEKKEEVIAVVLKVHMHCEACAQEIKKRILKMKGVQAAEPDLKASHVTVKGVFDPPKLVEYVYRHTGKHALVSPQEPAEKKAEDEKKPEAVAGESKDEKAADGGGGQGKDDGGKEKTKEGGEAAEEGGAAAAAATAARMAELMRNGLYHYYPARYGVGYAFPNQYPPQIFSDENPNACFVM